MKIQPSVSWSRTGSGRSRRMFVKLKATVFAPMASASVSTMISAKPGW